MSKFELVNLKLINKEFDDFRLPKEHQFLYKYFKKYKQRKFLEYVYVMNPVDIYCFTDHTGIKITKGFVCKLNKKFQSLMSIHNEAKQNINFEVLKKLEKGKFKIKELKNKV